MADELPEEQRNFEKESIAAELFEAISHPTRIRILKSLAKETLGFSKLKSRMGLSSSGNLSHHLTKLGVLVQTNAQGDYELTAQGYDALIAIEAFGIFDKDWLRNANALFMGLLYYSIWLTVSMVFNFPLDFLSIVLGGLAGTITLIAIMRRYFGRSFQNKPLWPYKER
ncbi:MAG: ArsR/SmtB family transcription factor [Candidatus Thorarchaeota archaeon]